MNRAQKKQYLCLMISLNVNPLLFSEDEHEDISLTSHIFNAVLQNHELLDSNRHWSQLAFIEAYYIKNHDPIINHGLKASKELLLLNRILDIH